jgi:hypothetical protein
MAQPEFVVTVTVVLSEKATDSMVVAISGIFSYKNKTRSDFVFGEEAGTSEVLEAGESTSFRSNNKSAVQRFHGFVTLQLGTDPKNRDIRPFGEEAAAGAHLKGGTRVCTVKRNRKKTASTLGEIELPSSEE